MKITHVARQFFPAVGGVENVVFNLARRQILSGHQVSVVTLDRVFSDGEKLSKHDELSGIKIQRIPFWGSRRYPIAPAVLRHIGDSDIIHIHCVDFFVDFLVLMKWRHGKKIVLHTHGGFFHTKWLIYFKKAYFHIITRMVLKGCTKVIAVSEGDFKTFSKISPKVMVAENGVDFEGFSSIRKNIHQGRMVYLGRVDRHKRVDNLIRVVAELRHRGRKVSLGVYGPEWNNCLPDLQKLADELKVADFIDWKGKVSDGDIQEALAEAQFFLSASEYEGFGISAVEAMASGTVCVLNDIESFRKILGEERQLLVDFNDTDSSVAAILELMNLTGEQYSALGGSLKSRAKLFSWESTVEKIERVYQDCL
ncbi:MAG TPA: glycosyltransferase family 4 protein [bacterium]|nr:glycosyltransferase family 4 protein [bacterium]